MLRKYTIFCNFAAHFFKQSFDGFNTRIELPYNTEHTGISHNENYKGKP